MRTYLLILILFLVTSCGYSSPYSQSSDLDHDGDGQVLIYLPMWKNRTNLTGFHATIQRELTRWLKRSRRFVVTQNRKQADFILEGTILRVNIPSLAYGDYARASKVELQVSLSYRLSDLSNSKVILQKNQYIEKEGFKVDTDPVHTKGNQRVAQVTLADKISSDIYDQLFYTFTQNDLTKTRTKPTVADSDQPINDQ